MSCNWVTILDILDQYKHSDHKNGEIDVCPDKVDVKSCESLFKCKFYNDTILSHMLK